MFKNETDKRKEILNFIKKYAEENSCMPSIRKIADGTGLNSSATAHYYVKDLIFRGYLTERKGFIPAYGLPDYRLMYKKKHDNEEMILFSSILTEQFDIPSEKAEKITDVFFKLTEEEKFETT